MKLTGKTVSKCLYLEGNVPVPVEFLTVTRNGDFVDIYDTFNRQNILFKFPLADLEDENGDLFADNDEAFAYLQQQTTL